MKYWMYITPAGTSNHPIYTIMSEEAIMAEYYPHWTSKMMLKYGEWSALITKEKCIQDWVTVHWAYECTLERLQEICMKN